MALDDAHSLGLQLLATDGVHPGALVQFAEGNWPNEIGSGVALNDRAFDEIEPHLLAISSRWTWQHRYGVFELTTREAAALAARLQAEAHKILQAGTATCSSKLFLSLAAWLELRCDGRPLSVLGF